VGRKNVALSVSPETTQLNPTAKINIIENYK
jgi:hypothetical protein